jgi:hypothetical protein
MLNLELKIYLKNSYKKNSINDLFNLKKKKKYNKNF